MKRALFSLTQEESKIIIAKAICKLPQVTSAMKKGKVLVSKGTTNAYIASELTGEKIESRYYTVGVIAKGSLCIADPKRQLPVVILIDGKKVDADWISMLKEFDENDVLIKGANAVDEMGNCGVLVGNDLGGTVGTSFPIAQSRGSHVIMPVSLGKLVPSVIDAANELGINRLDMTYGIPCGMIVVSSGALVVTELEAFDILFDVHATHVASGGICGSEGSVSLVISGDDAKVNEAFEFVASLKENKDNCESCDDYEVILAEKRYKG